MLTSAYLLGIASKHGIHQLDAVGQAGGNHVAWAVGTGQQGCEHRVDTPLQLVGGKKGTSQKLSSHSRQE